MNIILILEIISTEYTLQKKLVYLKMPIFLELFISEISYFLIIIVINQLFLFLKFFIYYCYQSINQIDKLLSKHKKINNKQNI